MPTLPAAATATATTRTIETSAGIVVPACLLVVSGMASLIFQVLWVKQLTLVVGVEVHSVTAVIACFFIGLGLGAFFWGRLAEQVRRPLALYGGVEIAAGCLGLAATLILSRAAPVFARAEAVSETLAWSLPVAAMVLPALFMGGTLPALVRSAGAGSNDVGRIGGKLYAANTFGAVAGALLPPFLLIPALGVRGTAMGAAAICLIAGLAAHAFAQLSGRPAAHEVRVPRLESVALRPDAKAALALYAVAGALALGYEVVWTQAILPFMSTRAFAFSIVLATYLSGVALGSWLCGVLHRERSRDWTVFAFLIALAGSLALVSVSLLGRWVVVAQSYAEAAILAAGGSDLAGMSTRFAVAALAVVFVPTLLLGAAFPIVLRIVGGDGRAGAATGRVLAVNTSGGVIGTLFAGLVLIPALGLLHTLGALALGAAAVGLAALVRAQAAKVAWTAMAGVAGASLAIVALTPASRLAEIYPAAAGGVVRFYEEGAAGVVAVVEKGEGDHRFRRLYIQGVSNSGDAMPSLRYMRLQALLPLIIHNGEPKSALVIGYGTGVTAGALLRYPDLEKRVVAELLPGVLHAAPLFQGTFGAHDDQRLGVRLRDGRRELQRSGETYDLITLEPPPPSASGVVNLYSEDFYRLAASRLNPKGLFAQWLPLPTQNEDDTRSLVRSFINVFPYASLWTTELHEMLLIGSAEPVTLDLAKIRDRFSKPDVASALTAVGVQSPAALLATYVMGRQGLETFAADARPVTDDDPRIEYAPWVRRSEFGSVLPDLLNLREDVPIERADAAARAGVENSRITLLTLYHAAMSAFAGDRDSWRRDMREVMSTDADNPYYRWFVAR